MQCPKCHRPLEDESEGSYICCAGATLQWRCVQCAKVSEGFAFPYGRCPHCGGRLELAEAAPVEGAAALEGIRTAFEIELGGRAFYQRAAADSDDPGMRALFARLARMEDEHMQTLTRRYHVDAPAPAPGFSTGVAAIFAGVEDRPRDPANLLRIAVAMERRAARFFEDHAARAAEGSPEHRLYEELAAEEREHADLLATELERWRSGKPGLFGAEAPVAGEGGADAGA